MLARNQLAGNDEHTTRWRNAQRVHRCTLHHSGADAGRLIVVGEGEQFLFPEFDGLPLLGEEVVALIDADDTGAAFGYMPKELLNDLRTADAPRYVSVVALGELTFGADLAAAIGKGDAPALREIIRQARIRRT